MSAKKTFSKGKLRAAIIGAGRIAATFDSPKGSEVLTHAHAYYNNKQTDLVGFFDVNKKASAHAAHVWCGRAFASLEELFLVGRPDMISVCTPDETHARILKLIAPFKPKLVIVEKPFTGNSKVGVEIIRLYKNLKIPLVVNYSRRFDVSVQNLKKDLSSGKYGKIISGSGVYTKGLLHTGSHIINLIQFLAGPVLESKPLISRFEHKEIGLSVAAFLRFKDCPVFLLNIGDDRKYGLLEITLLTEKARITLSDFTHQISIEFVKEDARYKGFYGLVKAKTDQTKLPFALGNLINNSVDHLLYNTNLISAASDAVETEKVCNTLLKNKTICLN